MFCRFFILRPVLSLVISIVIVIAGIVSMLVSPIEQYPNVVPPVLNIVASFPGASSEAIANAVAAPIEDQMSGIPHMIYMQSSSANGSSIMSLNVYFTTGINVKTVEADALNRINTALPQLPAQVVQQGVIMRMRTPNLFMVIPFYAENGNPDKLYISNYVQRYIYPVISQIPGVGSIDISGQRQYAMRASLDPNKLAYYKLGLSDITKAINDQNYPYVVGINAMEPMEGRQKFNFLINPPGYYTNEEQFKNIVVHAGETNAQVVKLQNVAKVKLAAQQYYTYMTIYNKQANGTVLQHEATALNIYLSPGANQIQVRRRINDALQQLSFHMPEGIKYYYHFDSSKFVILSIQSVISTLITAFILVFLVVMLFIQNIRGTIIPVIAIPVSIIGTFAGTFALGFSINTLTLFGMVLAIGIVVDDAIVVLENVERLMTEDGMDSVAASIKAMEEVASPVIAIVLVLNAVFVPVAFLGGFSGMLMQQFAVTIAISVLLSGLIALTLTPTLCAIFLQDMHKPKSDVVVGELSTAGLPQQSNKFILLRYLDKFYAGFNTWFNQLRNGYMYLVVKIMDNVKAALLVWFGVLLVVIIAFLRIPVGLIPLEDMGYYYDTIHTVSGGAMGYTLDEANILAKAIMKLPAIDRLAVMGGTDVVDNSTTKTSAATLNIILKDYEKRTEADQQIDPVIAQTGELNNALSSIHGMAFNQTPISGMSPTSGVTFYLQATQPVSVQNVYADSLALTTYLEKNYPTIVGRAAQFYNVGTPEIYMDVDAQYTYLYGITFANLFNSLQATYGNYYVNYFTMWQDLWWVILQSDYVFRNMPQLLNVVYLKAQSGQIMPAGSLSKFHYANGAEVVTRLNDFLGSQIVVEPNSQQRATSGEAMQVIKEAIPKVLGNRYSLQWFGTAYQQALAGQQSQVAFGLGLVMVFLILAALFELWALPVSVVMGLPFALLGAVTMLLVFHKPNDIYFQVSLLTLIGLSAKNAILIVEFAIEGVRKDGMPYREAALHAAKLRFRPIIMTSIAFILGAVPLVTASGAGANSQHSVGLGIIGGMLGSTCVATLFVPMFFVLVMSWTKQQSGSLQ